MKKVLILAYDFPPYVSVGGMRPHSWFKYLHESGVYPVVITRQWGNQYGNELDYIAPGETHETLIEKSAEGEIIRTPYRPNLSNRLLLKHGRKKFRLVRKIVTGYYEYAQFLFNTGPKSELYRGARNYLKTNKVDVIIATVDPFVLFKYAASLSEEFNIPWIADYRDPWSQDKDFNRNIFLKTWNEHFEKKFVQTASHITTVSELMVYKISTLIKDKPFGILMNGYDPERIDTGIPQGSEELRIAFAGAVYDWNPLGSFVRVFAQYIAENPQSKIRVNFYGTNKAEVLEEMLENEFPHLQKHVTITARMENSLLLKELAASNVMLLFNYYSFMGTKIFDYVGIRRKIILCYANDKDALELREKYYNIEEVKDMNQHLQEDLIKQTNSGIVVEDATHLKQVLAELEQEFAASRQIACDSAGVEDYSRKIQVSKLAEIIKSL